MAARKSKSVHKSTCNGLPEDPCNTRKDCKYIAYGEGDAARAYCRKIPVAKERQQIAYYPDRRRVRASNGNLTTTGVRRSAIAYTYDDSGKVTSHNRVDPVLVPCTKVADNIKHCHYKVMLNGYPVHYIGTRAEVFNGTALMTAGGLLKKDIHKIEKVVNYKDGVDGVQTRRHYPSLGQTAQADRLQDWSASVLQARKNLKLKGFVALSKTKTDLEGNPTLDGYRLYNEAKKIYKDVYGKSPVRQARVRRTRVVSESPEAPRREASGKAARLSRPEPPRALVGKSTSKKLASPVKTKKIDQLIQIDFFDGDNMVGGEDAFTNTKVSRPIFLRPGNRELCHIYKEVYGRKNDFEDIDLYVTTDRSEKKRDSEGASIILPNSKALFLEKLKEYGHQDLTKLYFYGLCHVPRDDIYEEEFMYPPYTKNQPPEYPEEDVTYSDCEDEDEDEDEDEEY